LTVEVVLLDLLVVGIRRLGVETSTLVLAEVTAVEGVEALVEADVACAPIVAVELMEAEEEAEAVDAEAVEVKAEVEVDVEVGAGVEAEVEEEAEAEVEAEIEAGVNVDGEASNRDEEILQCFDCSC
jgi:hypothetical protein